MSKITKTKISLVSKDDDGDVSVIDDLAVSLALAFGPDVPVKEEVAETEVGDTTVVETVGTTSEPENKATTKDGKPKRVLTRREPLLNIRCIL